MGINRLRDVATGGNTWTIPLDLATYFINGRRCLERLSESVETVLLIACRL